MLPIALSTIFDFPSFLTSFSFRKAQIRMELCLMLAWARQPASDCTKSSLGWTQPPPTFSQALMISELIFIVHFFSVQCSAITGQAMAV